MMGIRDRLSKKPKKALKKHTPPIWVANGTLTTKALFTAAQEEYDRLDSLIKSGQGTRQKDRKLVLATIAKRAGKTRSILNPRRQPELCDWIQRKNVDLEELVKLHMPKVRQRKLKSKKELVRENANLRKLNSDSQDSEFRANVEAFFNSNLLDDRDKQAREISRLRLENTNLIDKVTRLQHQTKKLHQEIAALYKATNPSQRARLKGVKLVSDND